MDPKSAQNPPFLAIFSRENFRLSEIRFWPGPADQEICHFALRFDDEQNKIDFVTPFFCSFLQKNKNEQKKIIVFHDSFC